MESWADGLVGAVIVAAGPSQRMRGLDKIWAPLLGRPLLAWAAAPFEEVSAIQRIVVVVAPEHLAQAHALCQAEGRRHITAIVPGGPRRRDSVRAGLEALGDGCALAVIHDGARPLLTPALILTGLTAAKRTGAATAATPVKETIKLVREERVIATLSRERLVGTQTPQIFARTRLLAAHLATDQLADFADDAALAYAAGIPLATYPGSHENLQVTTPDDLPIVSALLLARQG